MCPNRTSTGTALEASTCFCCSGLASANRSRLRGFCLRVCGRWEEYLRDLAFGLVSPKQLRWVAHLIVESFSRPVSASGADKCREPVNIGRPFIGFFAFQLKNSQALESKGEVKGPSSKAVHSLVYLTNCLPLLSSGTRASGRRKAVKGRFLTSRKAGHGRAVPSAIPAGESDRAAEVQRVGGPQTSRMTARNTHGTTHDSLECFGVTCVSRTSHHGPCWPWPFGGLERSSWRFDTS